MFSFVDQDLQELGRKAIGPYRLPLANARTASSTSYLAAAAISAARCSETLCMIALTVFIFVAVHVSRRSY